MGEWRQYRRLGEIELRPFVEGESIGRVWLVSVSDADHKAGSPKAGDMIARNPANHADQWLVAADYFAEHYEPSATSTARGDLSARIFDELDRAYAKHGSAPWGRHEFYGILKEEFRELEEAIFDDEPSERVLAELIQVVAVCFRYFETPDRYRGPHPWLAPTLPPTGESSGEKERARTGSHAG